MSILHKLRNRTFLRNLFIILMGIIILLGSTFAWRDLSQHKTNPWGKLTDENLRDVTLNDEFTPVRVWKTDQTIPKVVSVTNLETSGGDACIRLSLKEFLQLRLPDGEEIRDPGTDEVLLFATFADGDRKGEYLTVAEAKRIGFTAYGSHSVYVGVDPITKEDLFEDYATTNSRETRNGIYGKPMKQPGTVVQLWGDAPRANIVHSVQTPGQGECNYVPFRWKDPLLGDGDGSAPAMLPTLDETNTIRNYITLNQQAEAEVVSFQDWAKPENIGGKGKKLGNYWIVDTKDGWVYWGNRLLKGTTTKNFLTDVTLIQHPANNSVNGITNDIAEYGVIDYYIHVDMEATDESEPELIEVFAGVNDVSTFDELQQKMNDGTITTVSQEKFDFLALLNNPQRNQP